MARFIAGHTSTTILPKTPSPRVRKNTLTLFFSERSMDDPKSIEACVRALNSSLESMGTRLAIATACVVLGLLIEYWDDALLAFRAIGLCIWFCRFSDWNALERRVKTAFIGGIFITCGVAAELIYEHKSSVLDGKLQTENGKLTAILENMASQSDLKRAELETRIADIFGPRQFTAEQSATVAKKLAGLEGVKIDVYVYAANSPYTPADFADSRNIALSVIGILRAAHMNAEGWLLESCQGAAASNVVVGMTNDKGDRRIALRIIEAFRPEIGTFPEIAEYFSPTGWCSKVSGLDPTRPNKRAHDATINITIGRKVNPLLTHEMLEPNQP